MNPLFTVEPDQPGDDNSYLLPRSEKARIEPHDNPAVEMIRRKIEAVYANEPDAKQEMAVVEHSHPPRSKHQAVMYKLTTSGRSMADIQTAWHDYYSHLSDDEKHEVWQEFYKANAKNRAPTRGVAGVL
jgi:hypothetical protein